MTKGEIKQYRTNLLSIAEKHGVERDDNDNLYWKEDTLPFRVKFKKTILVQERYSYSREKWIPVNRYHIKRINLQKWDKFMSERYFDIGDIVS